MTYPGKALQDRKQEYLRAIKLDRGCEACGYREHPSALQFDHIDPSTKSFPIARDRARSYESLDEEIAECRVLCANCHSIHTQDPEYLNLDTAGYIKPKKETKQLDLI